MNRNIPIIPTIIFLLFLLNGVYLYVAKTEDIMPMPVQQVVKSADGTTWALIGDSLIDLSDKNADLVFSQHGFENHVGQVVPLKSGEWLLNVGAQSDYVKKAIARSFDSPGDEYQSSGSLLKCRFDLTQCLPWGEAELQFERAFEGIELDDGRLLLFKAEQQRLFLVDAEGFIVNERVGEEFWFGVNLSEDGTLFGLNTGNKKLFTVSVDNNKLHIDGLGVDFEKMTGDADKILAPSKVVQYAGKYWLLAVPISNPTEELDAKQLKEELAKLIKMMPSLLSIDVQSNAVTRLPYEFRADAEIERIGHNIYFSDFEKHEIKQFNLKSKAMSVVESSHLRAAFHKDQKRVKLAKSSLYKSLLLNGLFALFALVWLIVKSKPMSDEA